jgi:hypothetical protein
VADLTFDTRQDRSRPRFLDDVFRREPLFASTALFLLVLIPPTLVAMAVETRTLHELNIWVKPLKFEIALAIYLATLAWYAAYLPKGVTERGWYRAFTAAVVVAIVAEMVWVLGAAANGIASHFNTSSAVMRNLYGLMGVLAVILTAASLVYGVLILRNPETGLSAPLRLSLGLGLTLTFVLTVFVASAMAARTGHAVGGTGSDLAGLPLLGWRRDAGDLRVSHFFATHAMHVIPLAGLILSRALPAGVASGAVVVVSALFVALVGWTFAQALGGEPFLPGLR